MNEKIHKVKPLSARKLKRIVLDSIGAVEEDFLMFDYESAHWKLRELRETILRDEEIGAAL